MMRLHFTVEQKWHMCLSTCVDASGRGGSTCVLPRSMCLLCIKYTYGVFELIIRAISFVAIRFGPFSKIRRSLTGGRWAQVRC